MDTLEIDYLVKVHFSFYTFLSVIVFIESVRFV